MIALSGVRRPWLICAMRMDFPRSPAGSGAGFAAFAPDLYRGQVADTIPGAEALGSSLDARQEEAMADIREAVRFLKGRAGEGGRGLAVVGFSLGAYYALRLAAEEPDVHAVVLFYGTGGMDFSGVRAAFLGHFAEEDEYEPQENVEWLETALRQVGRDVTFHRYPGAGHWFFEPDRTDAYNPQAAALAWERTLAFLRGK